MPDQDTLRGDPYAPTVQMQKSIVSNDMKIKGDLNSEGHVEINGTLEGKIIAERITITQSGKVIGTMKADEIVILGKAEGKLSCQSLTLHFSAIVKANAAYVNLRIEAGAQFEGNFAKPKSLAAPKS